MVGQVEMNYTKLLCSNYSEDSDSHVSLPNGKQNHSDFGNLIFWWIQAKNEKYGLAREAVVVAEVELWDEKRAESSSFYSKITYHRSAYSRGAACLAHFNKEDSIHLTHIHWNQKRVVKSPFG